MASPVDDKGRYIILNIFWNFVQGCCHNSILKDLLGDGIFTVDGDKWRQQRKVSSYEFSTKILRNYSSIIFQKNVAKLAHILYEVAKSNQIMDIQVSMLGYSGEYATLKICIWIRWSHLSSNHIMTAGSLYESTLDSIFKVAFGVELDSMCASSEECNNFGKAFDDSSALILWRYVDIFWQMKRFLNIGSEAALKKNIEVVDNFVYKLIHIKVQRMHDSENDSAVSELHHTSISVEGKALILVCQFIYLCRWRKKTFCQGFCKWARPVQNIWEILFIYAGKDTTATTLSWLIYMLWSHPSLQDKVAQEVKEATKMSEIDNFAEFAASMNEETLGKMQNLHAAITETIRLYPPLPVVRKKLIICISTWRISSLETHVG